MGKPFILPRGSPWRAVPKRSVYYCPAVYIADPLRMLMAAQVIHYSEEAEKHLTIALPLCPAGAGDSNDDMDSNDNPTRMLFHDIPSGESSDPVGRQQPLSETPAHWSPMGRPPSASTHRRLRPRVQLEATPALVGHVGSQSAGTVFGTHATTMSWASRTECDNSQGIRETPRSPTCVTVNSDNDFQDDPPVWPVRHIRDRVVMQGGNCGSSSAAQGQGTTRLASNMDANDDDDFVDLTDLHSPWRYRDPECLRAKEERDMLRLDEEWIRVTLAYDVLRST
jgi:hypothetical protein